MAEGSSRREGRLSATSGSRSGGPAAQTAPEDARPSAAAGWRERLPDALPLFVIGVASFAISYFTFHTLPGSGGSRLPLWSLFSAAGAMVVGGGLAVIVAGGEPPEAPYDSTEVVVLPKVEYAEMLEKLDRLSQYEPGLSPLTYSLRSQRPSPQAVAARPRESVPSGPLDVPTDIGPSPPKGPRQREIPSADLYLEDSSRNAATEPLWTESTEGSKANEVAVAPGSSEPSTSGTTSHGSPTPTGRVEAPRPPQDHTTFERTLHELEAALDSLTAPSVETAPAPPATVRRDPSSPPIPPEPGETLRRPFRSSTSGSRRTVCTTCGTRVEDGRFAARCEVCEESLCAACQLRAEYEGHPRTCARCQGILALAEEDEHP